MPPVLGERVSMLELQNSVLKKTARERSERIIELQRELQRIRTLPPDTDEYIRGLHRELEQARQGTRGELQQELKRVTAEHEFYCKRVAELEEHNRVLPRRRPNIHCGGRCCIANSPRSIRMARRGAGSIPEAGRSAAPQGFLVCTCGSGGQQSPAPSLSPAELGHRELHVVDQEPRAADFLVPLSD